MFALSTIGLAVVLYLAYGSFVVLKTVCPLCVRDLRRRRRAVSHFRRSHDLPDVHISQAARAARSAHARVEPCRAGGGDPARFGAATAVAFFPREAAPAGAAGPCGADVGLSSSPSSSGWYLALPTVNPGIPAEGAAVLIVKFNDYQCPPCRQTYENYKSILAKYRTSHPGAVRFVTKDFPLDPECNFNAPGGGHLAACEAAVAVRLAEKQNRREAMEDWLFANQPTLTPDTVKEGARTVGGINVSDFNAQYASVLPLVKADIAAGGALGVRSTPTFFINGRVIKGGCRRSSSMPRSPTS